MKYTDMAGKRYGSITVIRKCGNTPAGKVVWLCKCDCGVEKEIVGGALRSGLVISCGKGTCSPAHKTGMDRHKDEVGKQYGALTVVKVLDESDRRILAECLCKCGNTSIVPISRLKEENGTKSCGCRIDADYSKPRGELNPGWKRGYATDTEGYNISRVDGKSVRHSRLVYSQYLGRELKDEEVIHHINGKKDDDRIENLMLFKNNNNHHLFHLATNVLKGKKLFLTGCGTFTKELLRLLSKINCCSRIAVYSRNEYNQALMNQIYPEGGREGVRYFIGDCCDYDRLKVAMQDYDFCIHAAAMKRIDTCAYNPTEAIKNNIIATENVLKVCAEVGVMKCIYISTDKSTGSTLYGQTKGVAEKLAISYNNMSHDCRYSVCKYPNVFRSRGSVFELWDKLYAEKKPLPITDFRMTRMWITIEEALQFVLTKFYSMQGGEIFIPDVKGEQLVDTARRLYPGTLFDEIGLRTNERLHESMLSDVDGDVYRNITYGFYSIFPSYHPWTEKFILKNYEKMRDGFTLRSCDNLTSDSCLKNMGME